MCSELHLRTAWPSAANMLTIFMSTTYDAHCRWLAGCSFFPACRLGQRSGCRLTTLFNNTAITTAAPFDAPVPRKKRGWLPLLTVLFCLSYGLMTMLIVEQGATIESQRALIRELFRDSRELSAVKQQAQQNRVPAGVRPAPSPKTQIPSTQIPSNQVPSTQAPAQQTPSSQAATQNRAQKQTERKPQFQMPSRPAADLSDDRRALITI
jgi:hypothetical protein